MRRFILFLSSNAGLGYAPVASGTFGTLAGIPAYWLLAKLPPFLWLLTVLALFFLSCWVAGAAGKIYGVVDDGRIVIDELVGYLVTIAFSPLPGRRRSSASSSSAFSIFSSRNRRATLIGWSRTVTVSSSTMSSLASMPPWPCACSFTSSPEHC